MIVGSGKIEKIDGIYDMRVKLCLVGMSEVGKKSGLKLEMFEECKKMNERVT